MVFSSLLFLFRFLPVVLLIYYVVPAKLRNLVLLLVSLVFYAWGEPVYVFLMIVSILVSYTGGLLVDHFRRAGEDRKAKVALTAAVAAGLGLLAYFKYANFILRTVNGLNNVNYDIIKVEI